MGVLVLDPALTRCCTTWEDPAEYVTIYNATLAFYKAQLGSAGISNKEICRQASERNFEQLSTAKLMGAQAKCHRQLVWVAERQAHPPHLLVLPGV